MFKVIIQTIGIRILQGVLLVLSVTSVILSMIIGLLLILFTPKGPVFMLEVIFSLITEVANRTEEKIKEL